MAASVWRKCWNCPATPGSMVRFLAEMMPAVTVCARANGLPMASTQSPTCGFVGVAHLHGGQRGIGVDFDDGEIGGLVDADDAGGASEILRVGVGGELDVDLVGLFDDVVVGDDVALGIDDEAGAEGFAHLAVVIVALVGILSAEEAIEEVLEVVVSLTLALTLALPLVLILIVVAAGVLGIGLRMAVRYQATALVLGGFGERLGIDVHDGGANSLGDFDKGIGLDDGVYNLEGRGIAAFARSFLSADAVRRERATDDGGGESCEQNKRGRKTMRAQPCEKRFHGFEDLFTCSADLAGKTIHQHQV